VAAKVTHRALGERTGAAGTPFTDREHEVLELMAQGKENAEIAASLVISEQTVKFHVGNSYTKMGVTSRTAAVVEAIRNGWVWV